MSGYHIACSDNAHNCGSGCCALFGSCANSAGECAWPYIGYSNPDPSGQFSYPGYYSLACNAQSRNCGSGCCKNDGNCATSSSECVYEYSDYRTSTKYSYAGGVTASISVGPLAGGIIGGVLFVVVVVALIIWYKKKQQDDYGSDQCQEVNNQETTNVVVINSPQDQAYGMGQPLYGSNMNSPPPMYNQPTQQIYQQPGYNQYQQAYAQPAPVYGNQGQGEVIIVT